VRHPQEEVGEGIAGEGAVERVPPELLAVEERDLILVFDVLEIGAALDWCAGRLSR
jgi:hypothetical protein